MLDAFFAGEPADVCNFVLTFIPVERVRRIGIKLRLDESSVLGQAGRNHKLPLKWGQCNEGVHHPPPGFQPAVKGGHEEKRKSGQPAVPVAAVTEAGEGASFFQTFNAGFPVSKGDGCGAKDSVIVEGEDGGRVCSAGRVERGRGDQGEGVVDVHDLWAMLDHQPPDFAEDEGVPGSEYATLNGSELSPVSDFVAVAGVFEDFVAGGTEEFALGIVNRVFSAGGP